MLVVSTHRVATYLKEGAKIFFLFTHWINYTIIIKEPEDIDVNPFFVALSSKHAKLYASAQEQCCLILVPAATLLEREVPIGLPLIEVKIYAHLLRRIL